MKNETTGRQILIIEDDGALLAMIAHVLEREGYCVLGAANGPDGIALNAREDPALIILDLHLPKMDGIETLRRIRMSDGQVLVVILTGFASPDTIREAADLDVCEYLSKPFENAELVSVIGSALGLAG